MPPDSPRPARIAFGIEYPLNDNGGVSVLVRELIDGLAGKFEFVLVSPDPVGTLAGVLGPDCRHIFWDPALVSRARSIALIETLAEHGVCLAHFHMGGNYGWGNRLPGQSPIVHAASRGIRVIATSHLVVDLLTGFCGRKKPLWFKLAMLPLAWMGKMQALSHSRIEIAVSRHDYAKLARWYAPLRSRIRMLYHSRLNANAEPGDPARRERVVLAVGHIAFRKGQDVLAGAFARVANRHPDWKLWLAGPTGEEECRKAIEQTAAREGLGSRIELLGSRDDAWELMKRAGLFVQPSREEALGLALQEALYCGCPALGTRVGGIPELIDENSNGLLVPPDDPAAMAETLDLLLSDADRRARYAASARASIERKGMTRAKMLNSHVEMYRALLQHS